MGDRPMNNCVFCPQNRFKKNYEVGFTLQESLIFENEYLYITPDLSALLPGHLLIVSHGHYNSYSSAPAKVKNALKEALIYIHHDLGYTNITWFEHGAVFPGKGGASIDHAHLHVIPQSINLQSLVEQDPLYSASFGYSDELFDSLARKQPYLWISDGFDLDKSKLYFVNKIPSQYLRILVMKMQGSDNYNWKNNYKSKSIKEKYRESLKIINSQRIANGRNT